MNIILVIISLFLKSQSDVLEFISTDKTNEIPYSIEFDCVQYSETLITNSQNHGFDAVPVMVGWDRDGKLALHEFVAFNTTDGIIWVEPQNDRQYVVSEKSLCYIDGECVGDFRFIYYDGEFTHTVSQP